MSAGTPTRPNMPASLGSAPGKLHSTNGSSTASSKDFAHGIQLVSGDGNFGDDLGPYLQKEKVAQEGFNYHTIAVFGSQSTGKSTLLNSLFGTKFDVMDEENRQQTTKGIWLAKSRTAGDMAENILVMDVEGTDGQERGEDQDFERKSALFALATSEVLLVNMWENQVGLYHGANMGLLKTVFEVNLQLFVKDAKSIPRSLLLFVLRDYQGRTPISNLRRTTLNTLDRIWQSISKPAGLENAQISEYFDFAFAGLPNKYDKPEQFNAAIHTLGSRLRVGHKDPKKEGLVDEDQVPLLLGEYHRPIPADGFPMYAESVWDQISSNKDLDLPTQQELLAQFRCLEISRECLVAFDALVTPLEADQAEATRDGKPLIIKSLGNVLSGARSSLLQEFETTASRYHSKVYKKQREELENAVDARLKILFEGQLAATHKLGITAFKDSVAKRVGDPKEDFAHIVEEEKKTAITGYSNIASSSAVQGTSFTTFDSQLRLFKKDLDSESAVLRQNEMRLLATRLERWIKSQLDESIGLEFNKLGSSRSSSTETPSKSANATVPNTERDHWDRVWNIFTKTVTEAESRFKTRATALTASDEEVSVGLWRLRHKAWATLKAKLNEELADGNLGGKLRESFEDQFRYDKQGVPRVWSANDDIKGAYETARDKALALIPILATFRLREGDLPSLDTWIGKKPKEATRADEEDLLPIGGVDDPDKSLQEEMTLLPDSRRAAAAQRFRKGADAIYVETERGLQNPLTQTPWYMWFLLASLGWNEAITVLRSPWLFTLAILGLSALGAVWYLGAWSSVFAVTRTITAEVKRLVTEKWEEMLEAQVKARETRETKARVPMAHAAKNETKGENFKMQELNTAGKKVDEHEEGSIWDD